MPTITVDCGSLTEEQREELIVKYTDIASEVMNIPKRFIMVKLNAGPTTYRGVGGKTVEQRRQEFKRRQEEKARQEEQNNKNK